MYYGGNKIYTHLPTMDQQSTPEKQLKNEIATKLYNIFRFLIKLPRDP